MRTEAFIKQIFANCREEPEQQSEMFSQLLMGANISVQEKKANWLQCQLDDGNKCWLHKSAVSQGVWIPGTPATCNKLSTFVWNDPDRASESKFQLSYGTIVNLGESFADHYSVSLANGERGYIRIEDLLSKNQADISAGIIKNLMQFLYIPYLWGGTTSWGVDCSGLVQLVFAAHGFSLPRNASQQAEAGQKVDRSELKPCDLVFFSESERIDHVAVFAGEGRVIHAGMTNGCVKIESLATSYLSDIYHSARRVI